MTARPWTAVHAVFVIFASAAASRDGGCADRDGVAIACQVRDLVDRISARFERAEHEALATHRSSYLQGSRHPELTIGIVSSPDVHYYSKDSIENWRRYAALHGYTLKVVEGLHEACGPRLEERLKTTAGRFANIWGKVCLLRSLLRSGAASAGGTKRRGTSFVMVIDADTFVQQPGFSIVDELVQGVLAPDRRAEGLMFDDRSGVDDYPGCWGSSNGRDGLCSPNTFLMIFRMDDHAQAFAQRWLGDALGPCARDAGQLPPTQRVLWHCTLPKTQQLHSGFLKVINGMERFYTMSVRDARLPLVHFQDAKYHDAQGVQKAILAVDMPQPRQDS